MTSTDDFSPIADQGEIERAGGIVGRLRRRVDLPPVKHGFERLIVDDDGRITGGRNLSSGEKYWARGARWVTVDVSAHHLTFEIPLTDGSGKAGYTVTTTVSARVRPNCEHDVVRDRASNVRPVLAPAIREMLVAGSNAPAPGPRSSPGSRDSDVGFETADELIELRRRAEDVLRTQLLGKEVAPSPDWLETSIVSLGVAFDGGTAAHVQALMDQARSGLIDERAADQTIRIRDKWRGHLFDNLAHGPARAIEVAIGNPTPEAIQAAVDQLNRADSEHRRDSIHVLDMLLERKLVDDIRDPDQWMAVKAIADAILPGGTDAPTLAAGSRPLPTAAPDGDVIDTDATTRETHVVSDAEPDQDWSNP